MAKSKKEKPVLSEEQKKELRDRARKMVMDEYGLKEEDVAILETALEEAKMPVTMHDDEFKLGERELDIRELGEKNTLQMLFRMEVLNIVYQRQLAQSFVDVQRLLMLILKKLGSDDIIKETDDLLDELRARVSKKPEDKKDLN